MNTDGTGDESSGTAAVDFDVLKNRNDERGCRGKNPDAIAAVVRDEGLRHRQSGRGGRRSVDAAAGEIADQAVLDVQVPGDVEPDAVSSRADAVDQQAPQVDPVGAGRADGDCIATGCTDSREAVSLNADRLADGDRTVSGRIEHVDLAFGRNHVMSALEGAAGQGEG